MCIDYVINNTLFYAQLEEVMSHIVLPHMAERHRDALCCNV